MNIPFILVCLLTPLTQVLGADSNWHKSNYWPGEYPAGIAVQRNVTLMGRTEPRVAVQANVRCDLPRGLRLHPWSNKEATRKTEFVYFSVVQKYKALKDITDEEQQILAGDTVEELAYGAEGYCSLRANGVEFFGQCPGNNEELYELLPNQPAQQSELWAGIQCLNGTKAFFPFEVADHSNASLESEIEFLSHLGLAISGDMIKGYGKVKEDNLLSLLELKERAITEVLNQDSAQGQIGTNYQVISSELSSDLNSYTMRVIRDRQGKQRTTVIQITHQGQTTFFPTF